MTDSADCFVQMYDVILREVFVRLHDASARAPMRVDIKSITGELARPVPHGAVFCVEYVVDLLDANGTLAAETAVTLAAICEVTPECTPDALLIWSRTHLFRVLHDYYREHMDMITFRLGLPVLVLDVFTAQDAARAASSRIPVQGLT